MIKAKVSRWDLLNALVRVAEVQTLLFNESVQVQTLVARLDGELTAALALMTPEGVVSEAELMGKLRTAEFCLNQLLLMRLDPLLGDVIRCLLKGAYTYVHAIEDTQSSACAYPTSWRAARHSNKLTERELQVIRLVAKGKTKAEISEELGVASNTVHSHLRHIRKKFGAVTTKQAVDLFQAAQTAEAV